MKRKLIVAIFFSLSLSLQGDDSSRFNEEDKISRDHNTHNKHQNLLTMFNTRLLQNQYLNKMDELANTENANLVALRELKFIDDEAEIKKNYANKKKEARLNKIHSLYNLNNLDEQIKNGLAKETTRLHRSTRLDNNALEHEEAKA